MTLCVPFQPKDMATIGKKLGQVFFHHGIMFLINFCFMTDLATSYDTTLMSRICNGKVYSSTASNFLLPDLVVEEVVAQTPSHVGSLVLVKSTFPSPNPLAQDGILFGVGYCAGGLSKEDCAGCLQSAQDELFEECSRHGAGAQVHLRDCDIRYEEYWINNVR
ncbi:hypothetical protein MLD38_022833 [Melastoma candidum]|uniref:Uncharacterized protein n=1 Tax=Melastoma candidum TaxID=119954 RepID=A0ACB9QKM1_9MYRT|nr:hypothetical protein MLD38_022833 [Melastoma candidum]